jgi:outer membrane protein assembly factor BamA
MKYPSETFGLGSYTNFNDGYAISFNYLKLHQTVVTKVAKNLYAGLGYYLDRFWKIQETGVPQKTPTDYQQYGLYETATASGFALQLFHDSRKNPINPNNGWYGNLVLRPNISLLGAGSNWTSVQLEFRKYFRFSGKSQNVLAFWNYNWFLAGGGKAPYLLLPSTGWDDNFNTGRGYIQGRFRGTSMVYLEGEYRFKISKKGFLGGVVFANAQSFAQSPDRQFKVISPAFGGGLRIKLNKFSGANLCIDYGIGLQGSRGISVNIGEIF